MIEYSEFLNICVYLCLCISRVGGGGGGVAEGHFR